ncbi:MAG: aldo/keto reductase [Candidatus Cloacimonetes bacterium]|nr:aldo/keto reductase [Candidatus Cloacimonadota bacterium]MDD3096379.1 aldo/keto reductase [Candidatus Cloacimonadota bacterium]MDD4035593.1 aldo/keto reductase [Candidatus Cloacimonadota bacterium]
MQYRTMPKSSDKLSILGFGCMRFPTLEDGKIDQEKSFAMLHYAYQNGVNYYDTAWPYHDGESETLLGQFLKQIERSSVYVATKLPCWKVKTREDMDSYLNQQLEHLQTDHIDYYLLHALNKKSFPAMKKLGVFDFLTQAKADGRIRFAGFSFHDNYKTFKNILEAWDWDFTQFMLNYLDTHYQAGMRGYNLASEKGIGIISMEPLRGGKLVQTMPDEVAKVWKNDPNTPLERALNWVWNLEHCTVLLSGMSSPEQVKENIRLAKKAKAGILNDKDLSRYHRARRAYIRKIPILCSECRYCLPCPHGVAIPSVLGTYNEAIMFDNKARHQMEYQMFIPEENRAEKCVSCGACLAKCPQHIKIDEWMKVITEYFS